MRENMKKIALSEVEDDFSKYLREAEDEKIIITRHGKPAGLLIGFASEDDWLDYRLENDPRFLQRIERARQVQEDTQKPPLKRRRRESDPSTG
jgi:prevent-host-death family protein